jgi:glucose/arabinose dehydrogenase
MNVSKIFITSIVIMLTIAFVLNQFTVASTTTSDLQSTNNNDIEWPIMIDSKLDIEKITGGLELPTGMAYLSPDVILVTEKIRNST